jgi:D-3-phosphoglycerate dehydrogenase
MEMPSTPGMPLSRPKEKIKILLLEGISDTAVETLKSAGYTNIERHMKVMPCATHSKAPAWSAFARAHN